MKFNLKLDEALFDDEIDSFFTKDAPSVMKEFDDDFSDHDIEDVLPGPTEGSDTGVASEIIALINDEWEAIEGYNNAIASLRSVIEQNPVYEKAINVLSEIVAEENVHVGQLQEVLKLISPNAHEIEKGEKEAKTQLGLVGGLLPVQSWDDVKPSSDKQNTNTNNIDETCTLCDVDDEM